MLVLVPWDLKKCLEIDCANLINVRSCQFGYINPLHPGDPDDDDTKKEIGHIRNVNIYINAYRI